MTQAVCVILGGGLGAYARVLLQGWTRDRYGSLPLGTVFVNLAGVFLMGFLMTAFHDRFESRPELRLFLAAGILGGLTTFSGLAWDAHQFFIQSPINAARYIGASFLGGAAALVAGIALGRLIS